MNYLPDSPILQAAFPNIHIKRDLGEGGQKYVYLCECQDGNPIALKIIKSGQNSDRTLREIKAASQFAPPRFPQMYSSGKQRIGTDEIIFITEEYIEGESLRDRIKAKKISLAEAIKIGKELIFAVSEIADKRFVHRDIKPENVLVSSGQRVVLLDFGIARHLDLTSLTQDIALFGPMTVGYAAPEQIRNEKRGISVRTDLFAWAVVMYELISGINPFIHGCGTRAEVCHRTLKYTPPSLKNCDPELSKIIDWCLKKAAHQRPSDANIVINVLGGM